MLGFGELGLPGSGSGSGLEGLGSLRSGSGSGTGGARITWIRVRGGLGLSGSELGGVRVTCIRVRVTWISGVMTAAASSSLSSEDQSQDQSQDQDQSHPACHLRIRVIRFIGGVHSLKPSEDQGYQVYQVYQGTPYPHIPISGSRSGSSSGSGPGSGSHGQGHRGQGWHHAACQLDGLHSSEKVRDSS